MRCTLRIPERLWVQMREHLLAVPQERLAYLLGRGSVWCDPWDERTADVIVRRMLPVPDEALRIQSEVRVEIDPSFSREVLRACYEGGLSLVDVHTHPFSGHRVAFSGHDEDNMLTTHAEFAQTIPQDPPAISASLVLGQQAVAAAWLDRDSGRLKPIHSLRLLGKHDEEVRLCATWH